MKVDDSDSRGYDGGDLIVVRLADRRGAEQVLVKTDLFPAWAITGNKWCGR